MSYDEARLREIFDSFDLDGSGQISRTEIVECLTKLYGDKQEALSTICDCFKEELANDGKITFDEFKAVLDRAES